MPCRPAERSHLSSHRMQAVKIVAIAVYMIQKLFAIVVNCIFDSFRPSSNIRHDVEMVSFF